MAHRSALAMGGGVLLAVSTASLPVEGVTVDLQSQALAHYIIAVCDDINDDSPGAIREYQKSVKLDPDQPAARLKLGAYDMRLNNLKDAVIQLKRAAQLDPQDPQAHYLLALLYSSQNKYDQAASEYEIILKSAARHDPSNTETYMYLGQLYLAQDKYAAAIGQFLKVVDFQPDNTSALDLLGSAYAANNQRRQAMETFRQVLNMDADNAEALNSLGYMYAEDGVHLDDAVRMARRALEIDPSNGAYYDSLGWALYQQGLYQESLAVLEKATAYIEDEILYDHIGDVYKALKDCASAVKYWRKSLDLDPHQILVERKIKTLEKCTASRSPHRLN